MRVLLASVTLAACLAVGIGQEFEGAPVETDQRVAAGPWSVTNDLEEDPNGNRAPAPVGPSEKDGDFPDYLRKLARQLKKFQKDENTNVGGILMGWPGLNGQNGAPGRDGKDGLNGVDGVPGPQGPTGPAGPAGFDGVDGQPGKLGPVGPAGPQGSPGRDGKDSAAKWKQCAWRKTSDLDAGLINACNFTKADANTHLHVHYSGNLRLGGCTSCCKRWFFTFNGEECSSPMTIDAALYLVGPSTENLLRPRSVEGYCHVPAGRVKIGFNVGNCDGFANSDAFEGWNSVSRIIVEEVPPPQV